MGADYTQIATSCTTTSSNINYTISKERRSGEKISDYQRPHFNTIKGNEIWVPNFSDYKSLTIKPKYILSRERESGDLDLKIIKITHAHIYNKE